MATQPATYSVMTLKMALLGGCESNYENGGSTILEAAQAAGLPLDEPCVYATCALVAGVKGEDTPVVPLGWAIDQGCWVVVDDEESGVVIPPPTEPHPLGQVWAWHWDRDSLCTLRFDRNQPDEHLAKCIAPLARNDKAVVIA